MVLLDGNCDENWNCGWKLTVLGWKVNLRMEIQSGPRRCHSPNSVQCRRNSVFVTFETWDSTYYLPRKATLWWTVCAFPDIKHNWKHEKIKQLLSKGSTYHIELWDHRIRVAFSLLSGRLCYRMHMFVTVLRQILYSRRQAISYISHGNRNKCIVLVRIACSFSKT